MNRPLALGLGVLLVAAVALSLWLSAPDDHGPGHDSLASEGGLAPTTLSDRDTEAAGNLEGVADELAPVRSEAPQARPEDGGETVPVSGVVTALGSCTLDPRFEVFAVRSDARYGELAWVMSSSLVEGEDGERSRKKIEEEVLDRATVDDAGRFTLRFPEDLVEAWVIGRGPRNYLAEAQRVDLRAPPAELALEARAGARLRGRLVPPAGAEPTDWTGSTLRLETRIGSLDPMRARGRSSQRLLVPIDSEGRFDLWGVLANHELRVDVAPRGLAARTVSLSALAACEEREETIELAEGATIRGVVFDPSGARAPGVTVEALARGEFFGFDDRRICEVRSQEDGSFTLSGVAHGPVMVRARSKGYLPSDKQTVEVPETGGLAGVELSLREGDVLRGQVVWAAGGPGVDLEVRAEFDPAFMGGLEALNAMRGAEGSGRTDEGGHFEIRGMGKGPFVLTCKAPPPDRVAEETDGAEPAPEVWHRGRAEGVRPSGGNSTLVLEPPVGLVVRLLDAAGEPVSDGDLLLARIANTGTPVGALEERRARVRSEDGRTLVESITPGTWHLDARAEGLALVDPVAVEVLAGVNPDPVDVNLVSAATVAGLVIDPDGVPAGGAELAVKRPGGLLAERATPRLPLGGSTTDSEGSFRIEGLPAQVLELQAQVEGLAPSPPLAIDLEPGQVLDGQVLQLLRGGTITGEVFEADGSASVGRMVTAIDQGQMEQRIATTDGEGLFRMERVPPGSYQVIAMDMGGDMTNDEGEMDLSSLIDGLKMAAVTLADGEEVHVVLGKLADDPIRVFGRVTLDGEPFTGAMISFLPEGSDFFSRMKLTSLGNDGSYDVVLDGAGRYLASVAQVSGSPGQQSTVEFSVEIEGPEEQRLDFSMPLGRISGDVETADGKAAVGVRVTLVRDGVTRSDSLYGGNYTEMQTEEDGTFDIVGLRPGVYRLSVGGAPLMAAQTVDSPGRLTKANLHLDEDQHLHLDLELPEAGKLEVLVRDAAGEAAPQATIFLRDGSGRVVDPFSFATTDGTGRCTLGGLAPGTYTVLARRGVEASQVSDPVLVPAGGKGGVEVELEGGAILWIRLKDADGEPLRGEVRVTDRDGLEMTGMLGMADIQALYVDGGFSPTEHRLGPLPPGKYEVTVTDDRGRSEKKNVFVRSGESEKRLTVRVRD